jgi:hypothetical protein
MPSPVRSTGMLSTFANRHLHTCPVEMSGSSTGDDAGGSGRDAAAASSASSQSPAQLSSGGKAPRVLDTSGMDIIFRGKEWNHSEDPCAR